MSRRADPRTVGAFILGGFGLLIVAVLLFADGGFWQTRPTWVLYFEGATTGLQVGSPVIFRGVKIGVVQTIGLSVDRQALQFLVPVRIQTDNQALEDLDGNPVSLQSLERGSGLVARGMRARLKTWSFLTGQLYIDLDFYPDKPLNLHGKSGEREIPTLPTEVQELTNKLDKLNLEKLLDDVSVISDSIRRLVSSPAAESALSNLDMTLANLAALTAQLNGAMSGLSGETGKVLAESSRTLQSAHQALDEVSTTLKASRSTLTRLDESAANIARLTRADGPQVRALTQAADELAATARALRDSAGEDSVAAVKLSETLTEATAAARALRGLAETLETQPESLLKGRALPENAP